MTKMRIFASSSYASFHISLIKKGNRINKGDVFYFQITGTDKGGIIWERGKDWKQMQHL